MENAKQALVFAGVMDELALKMSKAKRIQAKDIRTYIEAGKFIAEFIDKLDEKPCGLLQLWQNMSDAEGIYIGAGQKVWNMSAEGMIQTRKSIPILVRHSESWMEMKGKFFERKMTNVITDMVREIDPDALSGLAATEGKDWFSRERTTDQDDGVMLDLADTVDGENAWLLLSKSLERDEAYYIAVDALVRHFIEKELKLEIAVVDKNRDEIIRLNVRELDLIAWTTEIEAAMQNRYLFLLIEEDNEASFSAGFKRVIAARANSWIKVTESSW